MIGGKWLGEYMEKYCFLQKYNKYLTNNGIKYSIKCLFFIKKNKDIILLKVRWNFLPLV